jgi:hypothetical protein
MQDKSIDNALLALRKQIIRRGDPGMEHVEALLAQRGVSIPRVLPPKRMDVALKGQMRRILVGALSNGPKRMPALVACVAEARPEIAPGAAYSRTGQALQKLRLSGMVRRDGRLWRLVIGSPSGCPRCPVVTADDGAWPR